MYTPVQVAEQMIKIIDALRDEGKRSTELIEAKADTMRLYKKGIATRALIHREKGMPVTLIKAQSEGNASQLLKEQIVAEETLKAHYARLDTLKSQLNAWQSVNKYLESI